MKSAVHVAHSTSRLLTAAISVAFVLTMAACSFESPLSEVRCETDRECPNGTFCSDGFCVAEPADAGGDTDRTVVTVEVTPETIGLGVGDSARLTAVARRADGTQVDSPDISWSTSDPAVVEVAQDGAVAALAPGAALITAESELGSGSAAITVAPRPAADVTVTPDPATVEQGATVQLTADVFAANGDRLTDRDVRWSIADSSIATVDSTGIIRGETVGMTTVTAESASASGTATIEVTEAEVADITLLPSSAVIEVGQIFAINALLRDSTGRLLEGRTPDWSSDDDSVATVTDTGEVEGVAEGTTTIRASADGVEAQARIDVRPVDVATLDVSPAAATIEVGSSLSLSATAFSSGGNELTGRSVTWSTSDDTIADVSADGEVTTAATGTALISANIGNIQASAAITVIEPQTDQLTINPSTVDVTVGDTTGLTAEALDANGDVIANPNVVWSSDDESIAVVDASGTVAARATGTATITAAANGQTATATVNVIEKSVATVQVIPSSATIEVAQTLELRAEARASDGTLLENRAVTWTSANGSVVSVDSNGVVTGVSSGGAVDVTATVDGQAGSSAITVVERPVASVDVSPRLSSIDANGTVQLSATPRAADGTNLSGRSVSWSSTDTNIATVDASGLVTAQATGVVIIEATSGATVGYASVRVEPAPVDSVSISPSNPSVIVGNTTLLTATATDASGNTLGGRTVQWTTSDAAVAGVDGTGTVFGVSTGGTTITATVEGVTDSVSIDVDPISANDVTLSPSSLSLDVGETTKIKAQAVDDQGDPLERTINWSSSDTNVATVDSNGVVTAVAEGSATITASEPTTGATGSAPVTITWRFADVSATWRHVCAVSTQDNLYCWGANADAQLGDATTTGRDTATRVSDSATLVDVAVGHDHSCGLTASGNAYCWGSNAGGALGDGSLADSRVPVAVDTPTTLQSIAAGDGFTCGLTSGDTIDCWGSGADGQLGDGNSGAGTTATTPVEVQLDYNNWTPLEVSAGRAHVCVRAEATGTPSDKRVFCWGANGSGQLGDGSTSRSATPVEVDHDFSQDAARSVSAGGDNGCMVVEDASNALVTYCWGDNGFGQIGDGSKSDRDSPTQVGGSHAFATVHAGIGHACGVLSGGDARCWGDNAAGQLGNGASGGQETAPVDVSGSFSFDTLSLGDAVSCGIVGNGTLYCWGSDADGRLGTGGGGDASSPTGVATP